MRRGRTTAALLAPAALLGVLAGCSDASGSAPSASPSAEPPAAPSSAPSSAPSPSAPSATSSGASPSLDTRPAQECLGGTWRLVRFVGAGGQTYGTGQGGDVTARFTDGGYTLTGAGRKPITVTLGGRSADLTVDGTATGTYALKDATATFTQRSASGGGELEAAGRRQRLTMQQVTSVVGLKGDGQVACTADAMTITLQSVRLELGRT